MRWMELNRLGKAISSEITVLSEKRKRSEILRQGLFSSTYVKFAVHKPLEECVQRLERQTTRTFDFKVNTWMISSNECGFEAWQRMSFGKRGEIVVKAEGKMQCFRNTTTAVEYVVENRILKELRGLAVGIVVISLGVMVIVALAKLSWLGFLYLSLLLIGGYVFAGVIVGLAVVLRYRAGIRTMNAVIREALT